LLHHLSIKNYALIDALEVSFANGFSVITGETGAGKSILLGGLALVLGKRADLSTLRNKEKKCIIEGQFEIAKYKLSAFFKAHDIDYEALTYTRREILPSGKSRAFINDTPVTLDVLSKLGEQLIDVHSQHQTLQLTQNEFQLKVIDALADNLKLREDYIYALGAYRDAKRALDELLSFQQTTNKEQDYHSFLVQELEAIALEEGMLETLENQQEQLSNVEAIQEQLAIANSILQDDQVGVLHLLSQLKQLSNKLVGFGGQYETIHKRIQSLFIESDDLAQEIVTLEEGIEANPQQLETVNTQLQRLYSLQKKHGVSDISDLISERDRLRELVDKTENIDLEITAKEKELEHQQKNLNSLALQLRETRMAAIPDFKKKLETSLRQLGMPNTSFLITLEPAIDFTVNGKDDLVFLFSANKGSSHGSLKKNASGGELSRIMLAIKAILAQYESLPTLMFDEIDTGVSGEISNRMGTIMQSMSRSMQLFAITHLPQVASKGDHHYKVYKTEVDGVTTTQMRKLNSEERVVELAEMLGGKSLSDSAMAHARQLLN